MARTADPGPADDRGTGPRPHEGQPLVAVGTPVTEARAAVLLVHGRGASARDILALAPSLRPDPEAPVAFLAPHAAGRSWYPAGFMAPIEENEPWLSSALAVLRSATDSIANAGVPVERLALGGFSQGACLALEFAARHARRYGGLFGLSGGLIGPEATARSYAGSLDGTPAFLGCSDADPHVPVARVRETGHVLEALGGRVTTRIYPGLGHTVNQDEMECIKLLLSNLLD